MIMWCVYLFLLHFATHEAVRQLINWYSDDQCQRIHSKYFNPHLRNKYSHLIFSKRLRKSAICPGRSTWQLIDLVRPGPRDWPLRDQLGAWPSSFWLAKSLSVAVSSNVRNTIFHTWWRHQMETFSAFFLSFVRRIHRSPVNFPHKGHWRGALVFSLISARINGRVNNREAGDLRGHCTHYDVTIMTH